MYKENDKVILKTGETARISEVLGDGAAYIVETNRPSEGFSITIEQLKHDAIVGLLLEQKPPLAQVV